MAVRTFKKGPGIRPLKGFGGSFGVRGYCLTQNRDIYIHIWSIGVQGGPGGPRPLRGV